jgi:hypothetical protein
MKRRKMTAPNTQLQRLVEYCSHSCEAIFRDTGELQPMYHAVRETGENTVIAAPPWNNAALPWNNSDDKDMAVEAVRQLFRELAVVRYVFVCEAWLLIQPSAEDMEQVERLGVSVSSHPKRQEAVVFTAEDLDWAVMAHRMIERREGRPPRLAPLTFLPFDRAEGRMTGLLTPRGKSHG